MIPNGAVQTPVLALVGMLLLMATVACLRGLPVGARGAALLVRLLRRHGATECCYRQNGPRCGGRGCLGAHDGAASGGYAPLQETTR